MNETAGGSMETWDLWIPDAASQGVSFARGRLAAADVVLVHAAPTTLSVEVRAGGRAVARGEGLRRQADVPMTRLRRQGDTILREDRWPSEDDLGLPVILPGGEVGILQRWWHAPDQRQWRWSLEFYNHR